MSMDYNLPGGHVTQVHPQCVVTFTRFCMGGGCTGVKQCDWVHTDSQKYCGTELRCASSDVTGMEVVQALRHQRR